MPTLFLMRHGATLWGRENRFAGWGDTILSDKGLAESARAANILEKSGQKFDLCFTSALTRAQQTLDVIAQRLEIKPDAIKADWRLNERHYGNLQGQLRGDVIERHGNARVVEWRRSYFGQPPALNDDDPMWLEQLERLNQIPQHLQPRSESMADASSRVAPVWHELIAPALKADRKVLIVAHTSSIRGLVRIIEDLDDKACAQFRIATAIPRLYVLDNDLLPIDKRDLIEGVGASVRHWINQNKPRGLARI